jgi:protein TonB
VPVDIPPPDATVRFDPRDFLGIGQPGGHWDGVPMPDASAPLLPATAPVATADVDQLPRLVAGSCTAPRYPDILRQAGMEGRVELEFLIDTAGRAEPRSIRVVRTDHALFDAPARDAVLSCRFQAGRIGAHAVRVRVRQPVEFRLARR